MRLATDKLAFGYPGKPVGRDVTLAVQSGEILCLLGPNGGGKTTLFKTALGLLKSQGGAVTIDDRPLAGWSRRELAQRIAYVPQAHTAFFPFTVLDTVLMGRTPRMALFATPSQADREIAERALGDLQIAELKDQIYTEISGGQRQLVLIARALAQEPEILVMDEPTASLDFGNQVLVLNHIRALARRGIGIVLSSHDPDHAFACADRVAMLHDGGLIRLGPPREVVTSESLRLLYGVEVTVVQPAGADHPVCVPAIAGPA
ncbi:MAG: ABC transporter ATP-binding protein [Alphaproteobacteria bacterium]|nr:ABC transporter ATP-binding protein [Alphaproteobacteria bacterium]